VRFADKTPRDVNWSEHVPLRETRDTDFAEKRRMLFGPEQNSMPYPELVCVESTIPSLQLAGGRAFEDITLEVYISVYQHGVATVILWLDLTAYSLSYSEIVELASLMICNSEIMTSVTAKPFGMEWNQTFRGGASSFVDICVWIEKALQTAVRQHASIFNSAIRFSFPLIYAAEIPGCKTVPDLESSYAREIAGLANLWLDNADLLKDSEIADVLDTDLHPFQYGATYLAHCCAVEMHPESLTTIAERRGKGLLAQHSREKAFLALECELPLTQFFVVRAFTERVIELRKSLAPTSVWRLLNPVVSIGLVMRALALSRVRRSVGLAMLQFRNIYLRRKPYVRRGFELIANRLGTREAEQVLERLLDELGTDITMTYSMVSTLFLALLAILTSVLGILQIVI
jgi:hypothetical protein